LFIAGGVGATSWQISRGSAKRLQKRGLFTILTQWDEDDEEMIIKKVIMIIIFVIMIKLRVIILVLRILSMIII
jgi:hypothetical protein